MLLGKWLLILDNFNEPDDGAAECIGILGAGEPNPLLVMMPRQS